jgi:hypothetical protein
MTALLAEMITRIFRSIICTQPDINLSPLQTNKHTNKDQTNTQIHKHTNIHTHTNRHRNIQTHTQAIHTQEIHKHTQIQTHAQAIHTRANKYSK